MAGKIKKMIDIIIQERSLGNPAVAEMTKAKLLLKGINPNKFNGATEDDTDIIEKLLSISRQLNQAKQSGAKSNIKTAYSQKAQEEHAVSDICDQLNGFGVKTLIFFASSCYDQDLLSRMMQKKFKDSIVFGCSTAGEITSGKILKNSVVAMAFNSNIFSDAKIEIVDLADEAKSIEEAFASFENYYNESTYTMDSTRYLGIILIDGVSLKEEKVMDLIGNRTNVYFAGGAAGDDMKFAKTYIYANGKALINAAALVLLRMNVNAKFGIIKTQSFRLLDQVLTANKVNTDTREVIEFNNKPAAEAYAEAVGAASALDVPKYFATNPVGLIVGENEIFVRSPRQVSGTNIKFYCNLLEGMEVRLLESTNIIEDTKKALEAKMNELGSFDGIINFNCVLRTIEIEKENLTDEYGAIFSDIPTVGFSTYGEEYIGHINQTSTMLVFKNTALKTYDFDEDSTNIHALKKRKDLQRVIEELHDKNRDLSMLVKTRTLQLDETTAALQEFNLMLEDEINERTKREEEIRYLSYHDKLTGLYNRRFYEDEVRRIDQKQNLPISIIMGDVNGLKLINDAFGHEKGDELLLKAAKGIKKACRKGDVAARWGGDEFVILLPKTENKAAAEIVKKINEQLSKEVVGNLKVSVSFGWNTKEKPHEEIMSVLKKAEDLMYEQKMIENGIIRGNVIESINNSLFEKNEREKRHSNRVGEICQQIGEAIGLSFTEASRMKAAGILHDIGKIAIDDGILQKPGSLTKMEWDEVKRHAEVGYRILNSTFNLMDMAEGILAHHERWDGTGYPRGLKGDEIPVLARVIAIADSYDAMTSDRPYRLALSEENALHEIIKNSGTQFGPQIAKIFVEKVLCKKFTD